MFFTGALYQQVDVRSAKSDRALAESVIPRRRPTKK
jgi:hypothetical protein